MNELYEIYDEQGEVSQEILHECAAKLLHIWRAAGEPSWNGLKIVREPPEGRVILESDRPGLVINFLGDTDEDWGYLERADETGDYVDEDVPVEILMGGKNVMPLLHALIWREFAPKERFFFVQSRMPIDMTIHQLSTIVQDAIEKARSYAQ